MHDCKVYDVSILLPTAIPNVGFVLAATLPVAESRLALQGITGLLGRDILANCVLTYSGTGGQVILSI